MEWQKVTCFLTGVEMDEGELIVGNNFFFFLKANFFFFLSIDYNAMNQEQDER